jgi:hypothetical protein
MNQVFNDLLEAAQNILPHLQNDLLAHEPWQEEIEALEAAVDRATHTPCHKCGRDDLPLHTNHLCPECHE